jgi:hypothetical protein
VLVMVNGVVGRQQSPQAEPRLASVRPTGAAAAISTSLKPRASASASRARSSSARSRGGPCTQTPSACLASRSGPVPRARTQPRRGLMALLVDTFLLTAFRVAPRVASVLGCTRHLSSH